MVLEELLGLLKQRILTFTLPIVSNQHLLHRSTFGKVSKANHWWCQNSPDNRHNVEQCLVDLKAPDPRIEKKRIELSKDKLLKDSYAWILNNQAFMDWQEDHNTRLLWIKGDPGKGKTMMMIGLADQL